MCSTLLALFERGGGFTTGNGSIALGSDAFPLRTVGARATLEPVPIDAGILEELDRSSKKT